MSVHRAEEQGDMIKTLQVVVLALCLASASCDRGPTGQKTEKHSGGGRLEWVDPKTLQPGPIRREALSDDQMARIRALQATFAEVNGQSVEQWVDNFKRDVDPDEELRV